MYVPPSYHHLTRNLDLTFGLGEHHEGQIGDLDDPEVRDNFFRAVENEDVAVMFTYANMMEGEEAAEIYERLIELDPTDMLAREKLIATAIQDKASVSVVGAMFRETWNTLDAAAHLDTSVRAKVSFLENIISVAEDEALLTELALPLLEEMLEDHPDPSKYAAPVLMVMSNYKLHHNDRFGPKTLEADVEAIAEAGRFARRALECDSSLLHDMDVRLLHNYASSGAKAAREQDLRSGGGEL